MLLVSWNGLQMSGKKIRETGYEKNQQPLNHSTVRINLITEKTPEDQRIFALTQTSMENYQLKLLWKTIIEF